jgi:hypothetical protein
MRTILRARTSFRVPLLAAVMAAAVSGAPIVARAQDRPPTAQEVANLRAQVEALRAEVQALKAIVQTGGSPRMASLDAQASTPQKEADPAIAMLQEQVAEQAQVKVESASRLPVKLTGTIVANTFFNSGEANWLENPNFVNAEGATTGSFSSTLRQSRIGLSVDGPALGAWRTSGQIAFDFLGGTAAFQTGPTIGLPRLLYAFTRFETDRTAIEVGQDQAIVAPRDPTSIAAQAFPGLYRSGNLYLRAPQARVEHTLGGGVNVRAGIVAPVAGDAAPEFVFSPPAGTGERSRLPAFEGRLGFAKGPADARSVDIGVAGHYGRQRSPGDTHDSWAAVADWNLQAGRIGVGGELFTGRRLAAFGGAAGQNIESSGGFAELRLRASSLVSFNAGGGIDRVPDGERFRVPIKENRSAFGNVIVRMTPEVATSLEYRYLVTDPNQGSDRRNHHVDLALVYTF